MAVIWPLETDELQQRANRAGFRNTFFFLMLFRSPYLYLGFISLDMRRPWVVYWIVHGLAVLGADLPAQPSVASIVEFLATCQAPDGGFGGGPYQLPHLATTYAGAWAPGWGPSLAGGDIGHHLRQPPSRYWVCNEHVALFRGLASRASNSLPHISPPRAAVASLVSLKDEAALAVIDRDKLMSFFLRLCVPPEQGGGMVMHQGERSWHARGHAPPALARWMLTQSRMLTRRRGSRHPRLLLRPGVHPPPRAGHAAPRRALGLGGLYQALPGARKFGRLG